MKVHFTKPGFGRAGTEFKLYDAPLLKIEEVERDWCNLLAPLPEHPAPDVIEVGDDSDCEVNLADLADGSLEADSAGKDEHGRRLFPNALRVSGLLHVSDNCLGNVLTQCKCWASVLAKLRILEILLGRPMYRERFSHYCCSSDRRAQQKLAAWSPSLKGLRWQAILEFTLALLPLETALRSLG